MPTINNNILLDAQTAIENVPNLVSGQVTAQSLLNRYKLTLKSFGIDNVKALVYKPGSGMQPTQAEDRYTSRAKNDLDYSMHTGDNSKPLLSGLGTPVFCDMILATQDGSISTQLIWLLAEVNMQKKVIKTDIQGRDGTVKEYISKGDYMVNIKGVLTERFSNAYPKEATKTLISLLNYNKPLNVTCEYLALFNIYNLVVEDYSMPQEMGKQNSQKFEIKTSSDYPLVLKKKRSV